MVFGILLVILLIMVGMVVVLVGFFVYVCLSKICCGFEMKLE